jgi:hypothetical protein
MLQEHYQATPTPTPTPTPIPTPNPTSTATPRAKPDESDSVQYVEIPPPPQVVFVAEIQQAAKEAQQQQKQPVQHPAPVVATTTTPTATPVATPTPAPERKVNQQEEQERLARQNPEDPLTAVLLQRANQDGLVIISFTNDGFMDLCHNWLASLSLHSIDNHIVFALDQQAFDKLTNASVPTFYHPNFSTDSQKQRYVLTKLKVVHSRERERERD